MGTKSEYISSLLAGEIEFPPAVIEAVKLFKTDYRYNSGLPELEAIAHRTDGMMILLDSLCRAYDIPSVTLYTTNVSSTGGDSSCSHYDVQQRKITMAYKLSIITFLHEFAHALNLEGGEEFARKWSVQLFKKVYPIAFEKLYMGSNDPTCYVLKSTPPAENVANFNSRQTISELVESMGVGQPIA